MSDTPRTDAMEDVPTPEGEHFCWWRLMQYKDLSRQLELENQELRAQLAGYEEVLADKRRLTRDLDVAINGEEGAAKQASLCDLIQQVKNLRAQLAVPKESIADMLKRKGFAIPPENIISKTEGKEEK